MGCFVRTTAILLIAAVTQARADIVFNFNYTDVTEGSGFGFDDAAEGALRRATVEAVGDYLNTVVDHDGTVDITWNESINAPSSGTLGSMGPFFFTNQGISNGFVFEHATTGNDPLGAFPDGTGQINFGRNWNSGLSGPASNEFDLFTVVLHEITHSMGFLSLMNEVDGSPEVTGTYSVFDTLLEDGAGNRLLNGTNFVGDPSIFTSDDLFINTGNTRYQVFAPDPFQNGSSLSHFDFSVPGENIMFPGISDGVARRVYGQADLDVLEAIGWTLKASAVPEPGSVALVLFCVPVMMGRRRRRTASQKVGCPSLGK